MKNSSSAAKHAVLHGGVPPEPLVSTLAEALLRSAQLDGAGEIVYLGGTAIPRVQSYRDLLYDAARVLNGIREFGPSLGDQVVIQLGDEPDLLAAFWACQLGGLIPVPVTATPPPNSSLSAAELLAGVCGMLDNPWVIASGSVEAIGVPPARCLGTLGELRAESPATDFHAAGPDDLAALLLTSGSTGLPKAVMLTHRNILSRAHSTARVRELSLLDRTFNWMPLDHVGGLIMFHARDVLVGCHQVHARMQWVLEDPLRWLDAISKHECSVTWAPNFAFALINDRTDQIAERPWNLRHLRYIMNGGEAIKPRVIRRFLALLAPFGLPSGTMHPGWGMSETSSGVVDCVFSMTGSSDDDRFVPVGSPHPGVSVRIVGEAGQVLREEEIGRLHVTGLPITSGYYGNDEENRRSFSDDGWFKTGDLAFISDGVLTVTGRVDDAIVINGVTYYGHEIESAVEELPFVEPSYTVACDFGLVPGEASSLAIVFHPRSGVASDRENWQIVEHLAQRFGVTVSQVRPVRKEAVPKTGIGKIKRTQLARQLIASAGRSAPGKQDEP
ncbi:AMP-binding protein [Saccharopolyspora shandongensis]|uniref:AMP-binding protein n=1 Tax=Saccharopolyspora shandongensis TaxID=418495 RepID=UPI0033FBD7DB